MIAIQTEHDWIVGRSNCGFAQANIRLIWHRWPFVANSEVTPFWSNFREGGDTARTLTAQFANLGLANSCTQSPTLDIAVK